MGRLGSALALALADAGSSVRHLIYRSGAASEVLPGSLADAERVQFTDLAPIDSDLLLITTADPEIEITANAVTALLHHSTIVLHASGALSSQILLGPRQNGNPTASMHPLLSVSDPVRGARSFSEAYFCIEGDDIAVSAAVDMVKALGGKPFSISSEYKALYHASAVLASGHLTALASLAASTLAHCGIRSAEPIEVLLPLIKSTIENLAAQTPTQAMTGPIARGDIEAVRRHVRAFDDAGLDEARQVYLDLAIWALELASRNGLPVELRDEIGEYIKLAQGSAK